MTPANFSPPPSSSGHCSDDDSQRMPQAAMLYAQSQQLPPIQASGPAPPTCTHSSSLIASTFSQGANVLHLPPIIQVEKQQVGTSATRAASVSRRRNEANLVCPIPGCGSTFTRRFNLRGHLHSHTAARPFLCEWPRCNKGFACQHDRKRHQAVHTSRSPYACQGFTFTHPSLFKQRIDAYALSQRHLRSDGGADYDWENASNSTERSDQVPCPFSLQRTSAS
ncbi:hypothetical protein C8Q74DRAFT_1320451 [Fomes fomentarius]|nr:hypothetical protein C8Q74DRAFT_1320451 [Fomes fomentarius]